MRGTGGLFFSLYCSEPLRLLARGACVRLLHPCSLCVACKVLQELIEVQFRCCRFEAEMGACLQWRMCGACCSAFISKI